MTAMLPTDAEALAVAYLAEMLPYATVATRVSTRDHMVSIQQVGSSRAGHVHDYPLLTIQAWAPKPRDAKALSLRAYALMFNIVEHPTHGHLVREVADVGGPQNFPDPESSEPRWQFTVQLNVRPVPIGA